MIVRNAQPGKKVNLFDQEKHQQVFGVLFFRTSEQDELNEIHASSSIISNPENIKKLDAEEFLNTLPDPFYIRYSLWFDKKFFELLKVLKRYFVSAGKFITEFLTDLAKMLQYLLVTEGPEVRRIPDNPIQKLVEETIQILKVKKSVSKFNKVRAIPNFSFIQKLLQGLVKMPGLGTYLKKFNSKFTFSYSIEGVGQTFNRLRLGFAFVLLLVSFVSLAGIILPIILSSISVSNLHFGQSITSSPSPTPFRYDFYYEESKEQLYPITEFRIVVPKINLESNIVDNVDPTIEGEYRDKLQFGVAHAKGSYLPPESGGPVYLFAHSTDTIFNIARFNAKFYSVRELESGDEIQVYFNGKEYRYQVKDKFIINPHEVDVIKNATDTDLILQTCWPPGTDWQRLIVLAERKGEN